MKARDVFGIIIRIVGLLLILLGFWYLAFAVTQAMGAPQEQAGEMIAYFTSGIPFVCLGLFLLRCAGAFVRFSYPGNRDDSEEPDSN